MAFGAFVNMANGKRLRAAGAQPAAAKAAVPAAEPKAPPKRKRIRPTAGQRLVNSVDEARAAIAAGGLVPIPPEVVGVRVHLPNGKKSVDYPMARDFIVDLANVLLVRGGGLHVAVYPMMQWTRAELIFAPAK